MTRRIKRLKDFEISLVLMNDEFIRPPRDSQRNWILNRSIAEFTDDLMHMDAVSRRFVRGSDSIPLQDRAQAILEDYEIMEDWQMPIMKAMASAVTESHGDILEIGFGRGISANFLQESGIKSHTIIECNDSIIDRYHDWKKNYPAEDIKIIRGKWQDVIHDLGDYDGIFFHTYPLDTDDYLEQIADSVTFAEHFFAAAADHLRNGGCFTYQSNEIDSLSRGHQRLLFKHFTKFSLSLMHPLNIPDNIKDAWWADSTVIVKAVR